MRRPNAKNDTAYGVMRLPVEIVPDHSTIFRKQFRELLQAIITPTTVQNPHPDCGSAVPQEERAILPSTQRRVIQKR